MSRQAIRAVFLDASTLPRGLTFPAGAGIDYRAFESTTAAEVRERIAGATVVVTNKVRLSAAHLQEASQLKLVAVAAAGTDNVDLAAARSMGIDVRNDRRDDELSLDDLLSQCDAVTLHLPLTPDTKGLISKRTLSLMKRDAVLINTGRGALVDARALADALRQGAIGGAAIDALDVEPPTPDHPLLARDVPHLLLTPHVAWASDNAQSRLAQRLVEMVVAMSSPLP